MSGTTPNFGWTFPTFNDAVSNSWSTLAAQIDATLTTIDGVRQTLLHRPSIYMEVGATAVVVAANTTTTMTFNTLGAPPNGWQSPSTWHSNTTNPQNIVVPENGVYGIYATTSSYQTNTTYVITEVNVNGSYKFGASEAIPVAGVIQGVQAFGVLVLNANDIITVTGRMSAAGGMIPTFGAWKITN